MRTVCAKQAVRRAQGDRVAALARHGGHEFAQRRRVAKPVIPRAPQRVELHAESPQFLVRRNVHDRDTAWRRDRERDLAVTNAKVMVAGDLNGRHDGATTLDA